MAFTDSHRRCASFGVVTNLPDDVIDSIWYIIDHFLKHVFELEDELEFLLLNNDDSITFRFSSQHLPTTIDFDFNHPLIHSTHQKFWCQIWMARKLFSSLKKMTYFKNSSLLCKYLGNQSFLIFSILDTSDELVVSVLDG